MELHKLKAHLSRLACKEMRPQYIAAIKRTLAGIREICEGNGDLKGIRDEIERLDYRSGALPSAVFEIGEWNDPYGGKVASHRKYLREAFPETRT